jgi:hypothetical protein
MRTLIAAGLIGLCCLAATVAGLTRYYARAETNYMGLSRAEQDELYSDPERPITPDSRRPVGPPLYRWTQAD